MTIEQSGTAAATADPEQLLTGVGNILETAQHRPAASTADSNARKISAAFEKWHGSVFPRIGRRYENKRLESFRFSEDATVAAAQRAAIDAVRKYLDGIAENIREGRGLILFGPMGTGKDHIAVACLREAAKMGFDVWVDDGQTLYQRFRDGIDADISEGSAIAKYTTPDVLLLSDPLPMHGIPTDAQRSILWRIVDRRWRDMKPTWVTINVFTGREAAERLGPQLYDRLRDGAVAIQCNWPSYRKALEF